MTKKKKGKSMSASVCCKQLYAITFL
uniref:Uncharacterized protein n=1 Tax=Anguilla anguilla TaxID=7936 RepID=A0A0E9RXL9_ANGAN